MAKKLLEEATVRRFMKIAGIQSLNENFVDSLQEEEALEEEETVEEAKDADADADDDDKEKMKEAKDADKDKDKEKMEENLDEMYKEEDPTPDAPGEEEVDMPEPEEMGGDEEPDSSLQSRLMKVIEELADLADLDLELEGEEEAGEEEAGEEEAPMDNEAPEDVMQEGEHMPEEPKTPEGAKPDSAPKVDDADPQDPNQDGDLKPLKTETGDMSGGTPVQESKALRDKLVEQIAERVSKRLKEMK
jgi:hypothetical protein